MKFGPVPPTKVPEQDPMKVLLLAERWQRAAWAQARWAERAKKAVDFFEGRQWTEKQLQEMRRQRRPALTFNMIAPLTRLVLGYQRANKSDIVLQPGQDSRASEKIAEVLTRVEKAIAQGCDLDFVDVEVFMDGLIASRGFYDTRLDFESNDLGEVKTEAIDPFTVYPDPDAQKYDLSDSAFITTSNMVSLDELEATYGKGIADMLKPYVLGQTPLAPISSLAVDQEISPRRTFGEREDERADWWDQFYSLVGDFVDTRRKTIRVIEQQYKVAEERDILIDLETGDKKVVPEDWDQEKIAKAIFYAQSVGDTLVAQRRIVERIQWTTLAGDLILYDAPSIYDRFTIDAYFPYFRRGMTIGMVDDLIDPQLEKNKRRSARTEQVTKTANGGWSYHEDSLDPTQERNLQKFGSSPGVTVKWKGEKEPKQLQPAQTSAGQKQLEVDADDDIRKIAGINEAALGEMDKVVSGRALEARQRQAVLSVQMYMDNFKRTKRNVGKQHLAIVQSHYTERRLYRIMGPDGKFAEALINDEQVGPGGTKRIINDITVGKYTVTVDDAPISATFLNAQFEEALTLIEKMGPVVGPFLPMFADLLVDMSSMPRKDEWKERLQLILQAQGLPVGRTPGSPQGPAPAPQPGGPGGPQGGLPAPQNNLAAGAETQGNVVPFTR